MPDAEPSAPQQPAPPRRRWPLHIKILIGLVAGAALGLTCNALASLRLLDSYVFPAVTAKLIAEDPEPQIVAVWTRVEELAI